MKGMETRSGWMREYTRFIEEGTYRSKRSEIAATSAKAEMGRFRYDYEQMKKAGEACTHPSYKQGDKK